MGNSSPLQTLSSSNVEAVTSKTTTKAKSVLQTDRTPFPILKLPLEIRDLIYRFALTSSPLRTRRYCSWFKPTFEPDIRRNRARPSLNLLLANRQIYSEASRVLYHEGCFIIPGSVYNWIKLFTPSANMLSCLDLEALDDKWSSNIRNVEIEIGHYGNHTVIRDQWRGSIECADCVLARFPQLKAVTVTWQSYTETVPHVRKPGKMRTTYHGIWSRHRVLQKLQPLRSFGENHPGVKIMVRSPEKEVVFTKLIRRLGADVDLEEFIDRNWWREE